VPVGKPHRRPLLPYERQIIELAGCTVEEYQGFVDETMRLAQARPAGYDHIPEVRADVTTILISLAIGLLSSAASFFLAPKPSGGGGRQRVLDSRTGVDRFAQTAGFESIAEPAQYGEAVPIVWTKWTGTTGGVVVAAKLIWSRVFSLSSQQSYKLIYVIGEAGVTAPDLAGVYLGNTGLDVLSPNDFALWWNGSGRPSRSNLLYGTQSGPLTGDPQTTSDLFATGLGPNGFCQALSPSSNTQFGVSNAIPNATQYRLSYKIVSVPKSAEEKGSLRRERAKVAGFRQEPNGKYTYNNGGLGYGYFRRQGIAGYGENTTLPVQAGSTIRFVISGNKLPEKGYFGGINSPAGGGNLADVNNALDSECAKADDLLQVGETVVINHSVWRVIGRSIPIWTPGQTQFITLQCIEVLDSSDLRVLNEAFIISSRGDVNLHNGVPNAGNRAGAVFDNLSRINFATIKNTRSCSITQIGIKSNVWGRFNGLCNFNSLLSGRQIRELDSDNVSVSSGTMSDYFVRTSVFTIYYREVGQLSWNKTGVIFCVRGSTPVDQFHQITIQHGASRALEFRFVPYTAAYLQRLSLSTTLYWLSGGSFDQSGGVSIAGNGVTIFVYARPISLGECKQLDQMVNNADGEIRRFEEAAGIAEVSHYGSMINRSCDNSPEHEVVYVNEFTTPAVVPSYSQLTSAAISLRSTRNTTNLDQLRFWIGNGINNSNSFPELVLYLLQRVNGVSSQLIDQGSFSNASSYCASRGLFFDGAISERVNLRQYIADTAPLFLLNFVIANGKFALMPAIPEGSPSISNLFTAGNIIEGSFSVDYLPADQRRDFQALITYRAHPRKNELPITRTYRARFSDVPSSAPIETFDLTRFCTNRNHAVQVARYFLSIRRRVTHAIKFKTALEGAGIAPGSYIKVALEQNVADTFGNGIVSAVDGKVTSATPLADGTYSIVYYQSGSSDVQTGSLTIAGGIASDTQIWGALFTLTSSSISTNTYLVEQIDIDEDGLVNVIATEFPASAINNDMTGSGFIAEDA